MKPSINQLIINSTHGCSSTLGQSGNHSSDGLPDHSAGGCLFLCESLGIVAHFFMSPGAEDHFVTEQ